MLHNYILRNILVYISKKKMHQNNSAVRIGLCMIGLVIFGLIFSLHSYTVYSFFPLMPGIFIFVIVVIIAAVSVENSKNRNNSRYKNNYSYQSSWNNPYVVQNFKEVPSEVKEHPTEVQAQAKYCHYCGVKLDGQAVYCHNCGTYLLDRQ